ncbi:hypothetical protein VHEMI08915 [[Torrubiella] hemipterigena]|uniref:Uncharacterized protein n=1 Tax=[Torrubiella] hemipterigena TaxID=1531966 RepID=A0A0A1T8A1_9HYPO|nr:hypothetical protein VHEMI08915 [[Torrubiella] hemipterigena]
MLSTPEPSEPLPSASNTTAPVSTDEAASPSNEKGTSPRPEVLSKTLLYLNNDDMTSLHALTQPEQWQYQEPNYQGLQPYFPVFAEEDLSASFRITNIEEPALHYNIFDEQPHLPFSNSGDVNIRSLRSICDASIDSVHFIACLEIASKYVNANIFRHLVLDALHVDHYSMCDTQLLETAQTKLHDLAMSLLQDGVLDQFAFLFRCRIVSSELARSIVLENGLIQNNTTLLHHLLGTNELIHAALDLDAIMERAPTIRESIDYYGPEPARAVIYAAFSAGLVSPKGISALHIAVALLLYDDVSCLLDFGADVNQQSNTGESPLHHLSRMTESKIMPLCRLLIARGADVNAQDAEGNTCLHVLFRGPQKPWSMAPAQLLLTSGADTSLTNHLNKSVLITAISSWPVESVFEVMGWPSL